MILLQHWQSSFREFLLLFLPLVLLAFELKGVGWKQKPEAIET